jgi:membrane protein implicated in regulation of membrane protease activity
MARHPTRSGGGSRLWNWLLLIPFIALLWVPFYNFVEPALWGIPFFYWYQFLWVILTSALIIWVHYKND